MKKIVIICSGQPSANPRAVKEAVLLSENNYEVTFVYCPTSAWADEFDEKLFTEHATIKWICAGYHIQKQKWRYRLVRLRRKCYELLEKYASATVPDKTKITSIFSRELLKQCLKNEADLYIAHNAASLKVAVRCAKKYHALAGFDAEDFHRGEFEVNSKQQKLTVLIEEKYIPQVKYCTAASPLIAAAYSSLFTLQHFVVVNNVFSKKFLRRQEDMASKETLDLFWFSQVIGTARGIETVIESLNQCRELNIRLHLLGNISNSYKAILLHLIEDKTKLIFHAPTLPENIFAIAQQFDIGLATEIPHTLNREYCLTNKIFTYLLAGNALILSDTKAQQKFVEDYPGVGLLYESENSKNLSEIIATFYKQPQLLAQVKQNALEAATTQLNWEAEGLIFLELVKKVLEQ